MVNSEIRQKGTREAFETLETNLECTYLLSSQVGVQGKDQLSNINIYMSHNNRRPTFRNSRTHSKKKLQILAGEILSRIGVDNRMNCLSFPDTTNCSSYQSESAQEANSVRRRKLLYCLIRL